MINTDSSQGESEPAASASGAGVLALIASLVVCGIWFAFYLFVFLPRAAP